MLKLQKDPDGKLELATLSEAQFIKYHYLLYSASSINMKVEYDVLRGVYQQFASKSNVIWIGGFSNRSLWRLVSSSDLNEFVNEISNIYHVVSGSVNTLLDVHNDGKCQFILLGPMLRKGDGVNIPYRLVSAKYLNAVVRAHKIKNLLG